MMNYRAFLVAPIYYILSLLNAILWIPSLGHSTAWIDKHIADKLGEWSGWDGSFYDY